MTPVQPKAPRSRVAVLASVEIKAYSKWSIQKTQMENQQSSLLLIVLTIWIRIVQDVLQFIMLLESSADPIPKIRNRLVSPMATTWFSVSVAWSSSSHLEHLRLHLATLLILALNKDQKFTHKVATPRKRYIWIFTLSHSRLMANRTSSHSQPSHRPACSTSMTSSSS